MSGEADDGARSASAGGLGGRADRADPLVVMDDSQRGAPRTARLHYLDWLRVAALLGVFLFHALHPFDFFDWHVKNAERSVAVTLVLVFLFPWGLALFFLLAGAGSWFALGSRTAREYARERWSRLAVPFLVGSALFGPPQAYIEAIHKDRWTGSFAAFVPSHVRELGETGLERGLSPQWFGALGIHLWFLGFLFAFSLLGLPLFRYLRSAAGRRLTARLADATTWRGGAFLLAVPIALIHIAVRAPSPDEHDWGEFVYYFAFFVCGFVLFSQPRFASAIRRDWLLALVTGIVGFGLLIAAYALGWVERWATTPAYSWDYALMTTLFTVYGYAWVLVALNVGMRLPHSQRPLPPYAGELAMPFFVLHQPAILAIAFFVVQTDVGIPLKLAAVLAGSFAVTVAVSDLLVRRVRGVRTLFGLKRRGSG